MLYMIYIFKHYTNEIMEEDETRSILFHRIKVILLKACASSFKLNMSASTQN